MGARAGCETSASVARAPACGTPCRLGNSGRTAAGVMPDAAPIYRSGNVSDDIKAVRALPTLGVAMITEYLRLFSQLLCTFSPRSRRTISRVGRIVRSTPVLDKSTLLAAHPPFFVLSYLFMYSTSSRAPPLTL